MIYKNFKILKVKIIQKLKIIPESLKHILSYLIAFQLIFFFKLTTYQVLHHIYHQFNVDLDDSVF